MKSRVAAALVAAAACTQALFGQQPSPQPEATFRVQIDAVELDATVADAQGNPVTGLTPEDFEILEDGKPQTVTSFALVNIPRARAERPLFTESAIEPDVQSNGDGEGRLYVFALDQMAPEQALRTRRFLRRFLEQYFSANDLAAVVFLGRADHSKAQGLTNNRRLLLKAIDAFTGGFGQEANPTTPFPTTQATPFPATQGGVAPTPPARNIEGDFNLRIAMSSFRSVVEFMATVHGRRKALLLFSRGFPMDMFRVLDYRGGVLTIAEEDTHKAITAATRGNVVIYPIDPRGLTPDGGLAETETAPTADERFSAALAGMEARQSLSALATATGGFALTNSNSFDVAFDRIVRENSTYYVLGFSSTNERRDGRYRRLQVRVKRPGLVVRGRDGYMAPLRTERPAAPVASPRNMSLGVAQALGSPVAVSGLPMRVFAAPYKGDSREATVVLAIEVQASQLGLVEKDGSYVGTFEVSYLSADTRNKIYPGQTHTARLTLKPETYDQVMQSGMRMLAETRLAPGRYQMRVAAANRAGKSGSVVYDLEVPDFTKGPLALSGVALGSSSSSRVMTMTSKSPFAARLPGSITSSREFASGDTLGIYAEAYENLKDAIPHTVDLTAELRADGGNVVRRVADERSSSDLQGNRGGHGFAAELPLDALSPGIYVVHVEARSNAAGRPTVSRDIQIRIR
ncbi:MAG TPA: VWA domain-containing protein [Vicinamibacterales bacterium]|nr:VWA domain-containing protein [Vicinamibacterales bacterium]